MFERKQAGGGLRIFSDIRDNEPEFTIEEDVWDAFEIRDSGALVVSDVSDRVVIAIAPGEWTHVEVERD